MYPCMHVRIVYSTRRREEEMVAPIALYARLSSGLEAVSGNSQIPVAQPLSNISGVSSAA